MAPTWPQRADARGRGHGPALAALLLGLKGLTHADLRLSKLVVQFLAAMGLTGYGSAALAAAGVLVPILPHEQMGTFYIEVAVAGAPRQDYLVDTGAGFMTITDETLQQSRRAGTATYMRELEGMLADGSVLQVPLYRLDEITVGERCRLRDVEAAVLPGATRGLLGLSALRKAAPFEFSTSPPVLRLSNCDTSSVN